MQAPVAADRMGFDPRRWRPPPGGRPVTANLEGLLAENEALRREVRRLHEELGRWQRAATVRPAQGGEGGSSGRERVTQGRAPAVTAPQVRGWAQAMARHPAWQELRIGPPGGLRALLAELRARSWNPSLSLEQDLDRRQPGLGTDLAAALRGPHSRGRWAVRAAFALYGPSASEWLSDEPLRVVEELVRRLERCDGGPAGGRAKAAAGDGTASGRQASNPGAGNPGAQAEAGPRGAHKASPRPGDPRQQALEQLGLQAGASREAIKRAYRHLAKRHHPDLGGDGDAFRRLEAAYRLLLG
jgi:hypothetical protein